MPDQATIVVKCPCGTNLRVPASAAGKRVKCPKCGEAFRIKAPGPPPAPVSPAAPVEEEVLNSFGLSESSAASVKSHRTPFDTDAIRCNQCGAKMQAEARLCTACGFDTVTGRTLSGATAASPVAEVGKAAAGAAGRFLLGTVLSLVGAAIGGAIWYAIGYYTKYEVGYVAIGVGALAGLGMTIGYPNLNWKAGVVAVCMSLVGIIGAKFMIFLAVVMAVTTGDTNDHESQLAFVNSMLTEDILNDRGLEDEKEREAQWESAYNEAEAQTAKMGRNEVRQRWKFYRDRQEAEAAEAPFVDYDSANEASERDVEDEGAGIASAFFDMMFSPYDVLFVLLAIVAAYRIASGRSGELEPS